MTYIILGDKTHFSIVYLWKESGNFPILPLDCTNCRGWDRFHNKLSSSKHMPSYGFCTSEKVCNENMGVPSGKT